MGGKFRFLPSALQIMAADSVKGETISIFPPTTPCRDLRSGRISRTSQGFIGSTTRTLIVCLLILSFLVSANNIFLMRQSFLSFPEGLREAANLDGCGDVRFFFSILLPVSRPILLTVFMNSFVSVWNQYVWPMLVTTKDEMRTVQVGITMLKDRESSAFGPVMAGAIIALIPTILIFALFLRNIVSGMTSGAVKE